MADVELLPCGQCGMPCRAGEYHPFAACLMFKACHNSETVRANLSPLQAEIEALRAQLDEQCRLHAIGMERELALITERDRLRVELRCLREQYDERTACMIVHRSTALACSDAVRAAYSEEHHRAERLAEALRELRNHTSVNSDQIALIDAALEQENDDA